jgi:ABC-type amino acid transport substrate-binding protein
VSIPVFTLRQRGHEVYVVDDSEAVVAALAEDRAVYGYLWAPMAAWLLGDRRDVIVAGEFLPADVWDFGVALRAGDLELRAALEAAIDRSIDDGTVAGIFSRHDVPYFRTARK